MSLPTRTSSIVRLEPEKLDFGSQVVDITSQPKIATLTNTSNSTILIRDVDASGIDFTETDTCQGSLPLGASCAIAVTFTPAIAGPRLGTIFITDSDPASPQFLVLSGIGE